MTDTTWTPVGDYRDIRFEHSGSGIAKVTINRPEVRNAFRPQTTFFDRDQGGLSCLFAKGDVILAVDFRKREIAEQPGIHILAVDLKDSAEFGARVAYFGHGGLKTHKNQYSTVFGGFPKTLNFL